MTLSELRLPILLVMYNALDSTRKLNVSLKSLEDQSKNCFSNSNSEVHPNSGQVVKLEITSFLKEVKTFEQEEQASVRSRF